jgi:lipopolysaccharide biosynthesis regulator YciM
MDFDFTWLLIGLPVAFALGWMAARMDLRQVRRENRDTPRAYFKGLNLLLNEQQDNAIDAFIEAVQADPDTAELHFALGNLFRRRGEVERAVRVHEHLIARADLKPADHVRAQHALAQDFMRAGLFDRAEAAWRKLEGTAYDADARLALVTLYERSRDWAAATGVAEQLDHSDAAAFSIRIAHYQCELALEADARGESAQAEAALQRARTVAPTAARPLVLVGQRQWRDGKAEQAMDTWEELRRVQPASFNLVAADYARAAVACDQRARALATLQDQYGKVHSMALLHAWAVVDPEPDAIRNRLVQHLQATPSMSAAQSLLAEPPPLWGDSGLAGVRAAVDRAAAPLQRYRCAACGFEAQHWFWQCPGCQGWDSFPPVPVEEL